MRKLRREASQGSSLPIQQQFREGMTIEQRVAIINKETKSMMSTGNYYGAIECCNEAIALNNSSLAVINRAYCYKHLKKWKLAIDDFSLALLQDPTYPAPILAQRGICSGKLELYEQSLSDLNHAIELDPSPYNCFNRGCILADAGEYESAIIDFNRIIASKETSDLRTRSIYHRAGTFVKLKRYENAIEDLRGLLRVDPNSLYPRMLLGKALKMIGDLQGAEESVSRGIDLDPKLPDSYIERGDIRCRMGTKRKIDEAISDFHNALNILKKESTDNGSTRMSVINMVNNSHNQSFQFPNTTAATAVASIDTDFNLSSATAALRPNTVPGQQGQGHHLRMIRALSHMSSYQSEDPAGGAGSSRLSPGLSRTLSGFKSSSNNFKKLKLSKSQSRAEIDLKEKQKKLAIPHFGNRKIASCLIKLSQARLLISDEIPQHRDYHSAALHDAELAIQIIPSEINFSLVCVVCYIRLERYDQAAALLDTLLESHPSHKKVLYHRAFCYRAINNSLRAIECLTKIISETTESLIEETGDADQDEEMDFLERVFEMRGTLLHEQKAYKIAVVDFGKAIALRPNRAENYYFRGSCQCKLGNFERAISDYTIAEAIGFQNLPFLLMEKGATLRIMGRSSEASEIFHRAMDEFASQNDLEALQALTLTSFSSLDLKPFLIYFRLSMFYAMCLLDLKRYSSAENALLKLTEFMESRMGTNDSDDDEVCSKDNQSAPSLSLDTISGGAINIPFDGHLQWILKYHLAMCSHMRQDYHRSQQLLADCITSLRSYVPDGFALGSALFYHSIAEYFNTSSSSGEEAEGQQGRDVLKTLADCVDHLTECISLPWTKLSRKRKILCYLCRGKTYQRLKQYENSIADLTRCIQLYRRESAITDPTPEGEEREGDRAGQGEGEGGLEENENEQDEEFDETDAAYAYFRRGWSYKALQRYDLAANDFETAKLMKFDDPNFSINYRSINNVEYIEIDTEPDLVEPFAPLMPVYTSQLTEEEEEV